MTDDAAIELARYELERCDRVVKHTFCVHQNAQNAAEKAWADYTAALDAKLAAQRAYLAARSDKAP
jgi:hypothetical protein